MPDSIRSVASSVFENSRGWVPPIFFPMIMELLGVMVYTLRSSFRFITYKFKYYLITESTVLYL